MSPPEEREFAKRQQPIMAEVTRQLKSCITDWGVGVLELDIQTLQPAGHVIRHKLYNPGDRKEITSLPKKLVDACSSLFALASEFGQPWYTATVVIVFDNAGKHLRTQLSVASRVQPSKPGA